MPLKHAIVKTAIGAYFIWLFFCVYYLRPALIRSYENLQMAFLMAGVGVALFFAVSRRSVWSPLVLWLWMFDFNRMNPLVKEVHFDYLGWMLLYFAVYSVTENKDRRTQELYGRAALLTFGASYTASGLVKLLSPFWQSGDVLATLFASQFFQPWTNSLMATASATHWEWLAKLASLLELSALPLILYPQSRLPIWILLTTMQAGLLVSARIQHVSIGMLIFHALCFDRRWLTKKAGHE